MSSIKAVQASAYSYPITGEQIRVALLDPNSPFTKDLTDAILNAKLLKIAKEKIINDIVISQIVELKIEALENELAAQRKTSHDHYMIAYKAYNDQVNHLIKQNNELISQISYGASSLVHTAYQNSLLCFAVLAQALTVTQKELATLHAERADLLTQFADNQRSWGDAFNAMFVKPSKPGSPSIYFDMDKVPEDKQNQVNEQKVNAYNALTSTKTLEDILVHNVSLQEHVTHYGVGEKEFLQIAMNRQLPLVSLCKTYLIATNQGTLTIPITRQATDMSNSLMKEFASFLTMSRMYNRDLYLNTQRTQAMNEYQHTLYGQAQGILLDLGNNPLVYNDPKASKALGGLSDLMNELFIEATSNLEQSSNRPGIYNISNSR